MKFTVGERVYLRVSQPYLKTSDPMPMLRPPDLVSLEETGEIIALLPNDVAAVRFRRGAFLLPIDHLKSEHQS
ncbi:MULTISPECIES: DUF3148 domain-containing protein [unclassified Prochlorococcus]|uniref:DUF3148 domain-containing protein n=1 Tax=unclassified Prochlorococcus TaxID=2627481 RepID=UPI0005336E92|nr:MULTISPECIES: DUF3148 domain-containing protein [unclassified Prochlorococcus]KGG15355.1 hypothetical protein EV06_1226 [Prochlorococcus sp. MIT 0602]KGG17633.1 hypothetical protein EV07_1073 [Prochlorococcus sp. MIT 0603]